MKTLQEISQDNSILVAAHRGASEVAPENTIIAFKEAIKLGVEMLEADVQFTKDGKIVVYHNDDIEIDGEIKKISDISYQQLSKFKIKGEFANQQFEEKIPLFEELLDIVKDKVYLGIEIKPFLMQEGAKQNLEQLCALVMKKNMQEHVIFISFDIDNLIFLKKYNQNFITAVVYFPDSGILPSQYANKAQCDAFICDIAELDDEKTNDALKNNIFIGLYGVESEAMLEKALKYKAKVIGSDNPEKIMEALSRLSS